jgi:putative peptidoglycan lipid II flippase
VTVPDAAGPDEPGGDRTSTARNSATVAGWTLLSRVTGLLRVVVIGAVLGPTFFANSFQSTNVVPNIVFSLIAGPVLTMVVVPGLMSALRDGGERRAREVFGKVTGWLLSVGAGFMVLLMLVSPGVAWTLTRGFPEADRTRGLWLTALLVVLVAPQLVLYCLVHLGISAQRARQRFALSAAAPGIENVVMIAVVLLAGRRYGGGLDLHVVPLGMVLTLGLGSTAAVVIHAGLQLFGAARVGVAARPSLGWRTDQGAREVTRRLSRSVGVAALPSLAMYVLLALAGAVPGGVFVVQMSYAVLYALSYLSARAVSMASLPELADAMRSHDEHRFAVTWRRGLAFALIASLPLLVLLAVLGQPTATVLAYGKLEHAALVVPLGLCLAVVAVAQLVTGLTDLGNQALYARAEDRMPRLSSRVGFVVTVLLALAATLVPAGGTRLVALVLSILAGELVSMVMVLGSVHTAVRPDRFADRRMVRFALRAAAAVVPVAAATWWAVDAWAAGQLGTLAVLLAGGLASVAVYGLILRPALRDPSRVG